MSNNFQMMEEIQQLRNMVNQLSAKVNSLQDENNKMKNLFRSAKTIKVAYKDFDATYGRLALRLYYTNEDYMVHANRVEGWRHEGEAIGYAFTEDPKIYIGE